MKLSQLLDQMHFSLTTFGPKLRRKGIIEHIRKELDELENMPDNQDHAEEWIDLLILSLDGLWRELHINQHQPWDHVPQIIRYKYKRKMQKNRDRVWPDWRDFSDEQAIEHNREHDT